MGGKIFIDERYENKPILEIKIRNRFEFKIIFKAPNIILFLNTLRTGEADLFFLTRWNSVHLQVLLSATPQGGMFPEVSLPQALLGSLVSISWKFQFTEVVSEFVINF